jgi:RNA polymerase sigma factor (sigma-70 family)
MVQYSETEIIKGCQQNLRASQEQLYKHYYSLFLKMCVRYAKNMEDAEQLLNDSFLRIFKNIGNFKNTGSFEGWMKRIVINTCLDYLKSKQLKDTQKINTNIIIEETNLAVSTDALRRLEFRDLLTLIQTLPAMSKTVFNLYVFEGYSHKEIGAMLEISENTSSWHLHNARHNLQNKLKKTKAAPTVYESKRI